MRIGIIGSGNIGATLARLLVDVGHEVAISNSRGPASLSTLVEQLGPSARAATVAEAAAFGEVVIEAIPFGRYQNLPATLLSGRILVTAGNYHPQRDGVIDLRGGTQSQLVAGQPRALPAGWDRPLKENGEAITARLVETWGSGAQFEAILVGGGGAELAPLVAAIQKRFAHARAVANPQTAIARGYARLARRLATGARS